MLVFPPLLRGENTNKGPKQNEDGMSNLTKAEQEMRQLERALSRLSGVSKVLIFYDEVEDEKVAIWFASACDSTTAKLARIMRKFPEWAFEIDELDGRDGDELSISGKWADARKLAIALL